MTIDVNALSAKQEAENIIFTAKKKVLQTFVGLSEGELIEINAQVHNINSVFNEETHRYNTERGYREAFGEPQIPPIPELAEGIELENWQVKLLSLADSDRRLSPLTLGLVRDYLHNAAR